MFIKLRKQYSPDLDSPGGGNGYFTGDENQNPSTETVDIAKQTTSTEDVGNTGNLENQEVEKELKKEEGAAATATSTTEEENIFIEASRIAGFEIGEEEIPDSVEGLAKFAEIAKVTGRTEGEQAAFEMIEQKSPAAVELFKWQQANPNRDEKEFYAQKLGTPSIDPETIDKANTELHKDILYKDFMKRGIPEKMAANMAQASVDSNASYDDAKEVLRIAAEEQAAEKTKREEEEARTAQKRYDDFVADIKARETTVRSGKLGNVLIPENQREAFIQANYYDAGDPEYPNMSAIDIKLAKMSGEQKDLFRYLIHNDLNIDSLIRAKEQTRTVSGIISKSGVSGSRVSGGANRTSGNDNRKLDSPNQSY